MNKKYTEAQKDWIKENSPHLSDKDACVKFNEVFGDNMSIKAFHKLRQRLGVTKPRGRPKGAKDEKQRKTKKFLSVKEERWVADNWNKLSHRDMAAKLDVSIGCISNVKYSKNLVSKIGVNPTKCTLEELKGKCGLYCIVTEDGKNYICSSVNIHKSLKNNLRELDRGNHINKSLQEAYNNQAWFGILEECSEDELISKKQYYIEHGSQLHNKQNYFDVEYDIEELYLKVINNCQSKGGCLEFQGKTDSNGYGNIKVTRNNTTRYFKAHRIVYLYHHPEHHRSVIRHLCHNKLCCNIDCLTHGSVSDNNQDNHRDNNEYFIKRFLETGYDLEILMTEFNLSRKGVQQKVSRMKLLVQYPELRQLKK